MADTSNDLIFFLDSREALRLTPTATGFEIIIPDNTTLTKAAHDFVEIVKELLIHARRVN